MLISLEWDSSDVIAGPLRPSRFFSGEFGNAVRHLWADGFIDGFIGGAALPIRRKSAPALPYGEVDGIQSEKRNFERINSGK